MMPYNARVGGGSNAMAREYAGGSINGILRKTGSAAMAAGANNGANGASTAYGGAATAAGAAGADARQPAVELLVFGYACKIFRDDEKAREMDQGKQLIPWMGDVNLKIDRYDVRGALCELSSYEAPPGGYGNRLEYLTADEQRAEQLCEEERYLFLYNNEEELRLQQEEDLKRLQQETSGGNYSQVDFHYDGQSTSAKSTAAADGVASPMPDSTTPTDESELPFTLPNNLLVAPMPGIQLPETMKQHAIIEKTARFIATQGAQMEILIKAKQANNAQFDFLSQGGQLQPYYRHLLAVIKQGKYAPSVDTAAEKTSTSADGSALPPSPKRNNQVITVPIIKYKPSANCAYTQLISKIKGVPLQAVLDDDVTSQHSGGTASPTLSCKSEGQSQSSVAATSNGEFTPVLLQYNGSTFAHEEENANDAPPKVELLKNTSALALAQNYSSDSDEEDDEDDNSNSQGQKGKQSQSTSGGISSLPTAVVAPPPLLNFPLPEETLRHIIDKTATYVIKNGRQFEETLRTKSVERFNFLLPEHKFYAYYMYKITGDVDAASKEEKTRKAAAVAAALISKKGLGGTALGATTAAAAATTTVATSSEKSPVCFSIKSRDETATLQPALPQETSDDDADDVKMKANTEQTRPGMPDSVQRAIKQVETQLLARSGGQKTTTVAGTTTGAGVTLPLKEQRQAEERVKDKLALIARDKLNGMVSREKQLQLERKRKAMAFLNQIKGESTGAVGTVGSEATAQEATNEKSEAVPANNNEDSNDSVRSIPITYFGPDDDDDEVLAPSAVAQPALKVDNEDEEEDDGDLEKYNLLNDDSTNTYTSKTATASVLLSDDDDVQLVSTAAPLPSSSSTSSTRHRHAVRRSRSPSRSSSSASCSGTQDASVTSSSSSRSRSRSPHRKRDRERERSRHKRKASAIAKHRRHRRSRSRSRSRTSSPHRRTQSRSRSSSHSSARRHRGHHRDEEESSSRRRNHQRHASKKSHKRHKRRRRSSGGSVSQ
ncbi:protein suppressor of white apricot [Drosophila sulfurigaster albostrigata]|uniref:protein suppressor of white apricot n=1 Tax=Drosophila sulfurigaster albostrigata TaxID=89887 RepID=UPI002D21B99C|nr:protein suppressor of white apricot [Drosophila sulfurigaster albostrigata]